MVKLTPILLVEEIEPCLTFWVEHLDFSVTVSVPEGDYLGFAKLKKGGVEIMYQTRASLRKDLPLLSEQSFHASTVLYVEVDDVKDVLERLSHSDYEVLVPNRNALHTAHEIFVREPGCSVMQVLLRQTEL